MTRPEDKTQLRKTAFAARKEAHDTFGAAPDMATAHLLQAIGPVTGQIIAGYMPIRTEIDPRPAMEVLAQDNQLCLPVILAKDRPLLFRAWVYNGPLIVGEFGAKIPPDGAAVSPDILIVPLVGFDPHGQRLGYGGGFYDRSLAQLRAANPRLRAIGLAYEAQRLPHLPTEATDQPLDLVVTEAAIHHPALAHGGKGD
ncbi:5-formyltetrahydrofolate cyclo-ligase [Rhodobacteraceae bacterium XHP0102]|nr:5-formyltetrahydrofolate cyclo-ligase [Rhodobacteraceae bacterium XHP0102]